MKYYLLLLICMSISISLFAQETNTTTQDSLDFIERLSQGRADVADISHGVLGKWRDKKGKGGLEVSYSHARFVDKKGRVFEGPWRVNKESVGYALQILDESDNIVKHLPIASRLEVTEWRLDMNLRTYKRVFE